jgi:hypothetical protein
MKLKNLVITAAVLAAFSISAYAQTGGGKSERVRFAKGAKSGTYAGTVSHSSDAYFLTAKRGQTLIVKITGSGEPAFHLGTVPPKSQNSNEYKPISSKDLKTYTYKINTDDDIAILVGAIRGSSSYKLTITIK